MLSKILLNGGGGKIRTFEDRSQRVYSPPHLTALEPLLIWGSVPLFNKASNNTRFIYFICVIAIRDLLRKYTKKRVKLEQIYEQIIIFYHWAACCYGSSEKSKKKGFKNFSH